MAVKETLLILSFILLPLIIDANQRGKPEGRHKHKRSFGILKLDSDVSFSSIPRSNDQ